MLFRSLVVTIGLVAMAVFYGWVAATTSASLSYGIIAAQMVLYGLGMGLSSAPATESIMGAISRSRAGVGSAVNDATRLIGGTLGVAVIGAAVAGTTTASSGPALALATHVGWWIMVGLGLAVLVFGLVTTGRWARATSSRVAAELVPAHA